MVYVCVWKLQEISKLKFIFLARASSIFSHFHKIWHRCLLLRLYSALPVHSFGGTLNQGTLCVLSRSFKQLQWNPKTVALLESLFLFLTSWQSRIRWSQAVTPHEKNKASDSESSWASTDGGEIQRLVCVFIFKSHYISIFHLMYTA